MKLRLTPPNEPGYILERVPVHDTKEVWGVLEVKNAQRIEIFAPPLISFPRQSQIVREQCWLNENLLGCDWQPEDTSSFAEESPADEVVVEDSEAELQAILSGSFESPAYLIHCSARFTRQCFFVSGSYTPKVLPVNVYLPHPVDQPVTFDPFSVSEPQRPKIVMTSPERPPITGLVEVTVSFDEAKPRGVAVEVRGAVGADIKMDVLEEATRRGGVFGLAGRIWLRSHGLGI